MHYAEGSRLSRQPLPDVPRPGRQAAVTGTPPASGFPRSPTKGCAAMVPEPRSADQELSATWMDADGGMTLRVVRHPEHTIRVRVVGEVDLNTARRLDEVLQARVHDRLEEVEIDLSGVTFF